MSNAMLNDIVKKNGKKSAQKRERSPERIESHPNPFLEFKQEKSESEYWVVQTAFNENEFLQRHEEFLKTFPEVRTTRIETTKVTKMFLHKNPEVKTSTTAVFCCPMYWDVTQFSDAFEGCNYYKPEFKNSKNKNN